MTVFNTVTSSSITTPDVLRTGYSLDDVARIEAETKLATLYELHRLTEAVREIAGPGRALGLRTLLTRRAASKLVVPP